MRPTVLALLFVIGAAGSGESQTVLSPEPISLSGPRVGFTYLDDGVLKTLKSYRRDARPMLSQFGWQFERQLFHNQAGITAVTEWVVLVGGLEQGMTIPSASWLVGVRTGSGVELGVGPNLTPVGPALAFAAGVTFRSGALNVPVNIAVVPSRQGRRYSVLTGFNLRRE